MPTRPSRKNRNKKKDEKIIVKTVALDFYVLSVQDTKHYFSTQHTGQTVTVNIPRFADVAIQQALCESE